MTDPAKRSGDERARSESVARASPTAATVGPDSAERVGEVYGSRKLERLAALKRRWDPENVFHRNANIAPAPAR